MVTKWTFSEPISPVDLQNALSLALCLESAANNLNLNQRYTWYQTGSMRQFIRVATRGTAAK